MYHTANPILTQNKNPIKIKHDQVNNMKQKNYGKWYLKPKDFNKKNVQLQVKFKNIVDAEKL